MYKNWRKKLKNLTNEFEELKNCSERLNNNLSLEIVKLKDNFSLLN